ncbi:MAG: hypothetical protein A2W93_01660 [Bacteroidetes bacterium GWF2_43_63]|nr:MAG: hypothetical protein A2W94_10415 [Bacteroidetes bacterium GWE2_42_42]OFY55774.1 MAG: hypothetical protein A2W93_01660 [Bacteroidetes bacterium GWF2_43_63]HBG71310.1 hypothetical protein [Bacteroidales bacterium]HCB60469.1 hypothetical protein [Bacteroidales bacterium]HCY22574.1 hypothetical protein [Bacteroidales bacterium]
MKTLIRITSVIAVILILSPNVNATVKLTGILQDSTDQKPLAFANVALIHQSDSSFLTGTTTDENGKFQLNVPDTGNYFLRVSYLGYGTQFKPLVMAEGEPDMSLGIIPVAKSAQALNEVTITAQKPMYAYEGEKKIYNVSEDPSVQGGVANDALQNAPGVYVDMEGNITLRGVSGVEIWINDKPSRISAEGLKQFLQQLPANSLERIEVITNPSAKYSAEGTGGIINIITRDKIKKNLLLSFGLNGSTLGNYSPWVSFVASNDKLSFNIYMSHSNHKWEGNNSSKGFVFNGADTAYSFSNGSEYNYEGNWNYGHLSLSYDYNKNNSIETWFGGSFSSNENSSSSSSSRTTGGGETFKYTSENSGSRKGNSMNGGLTYEHRFKKEGHKFSLDSYFWTWNQDGESSYSKLFEIQTWDNLKYIENGENSNLSFSGEAHYTNPLAKNRTIEAGGEFSRDMQNENSPIDTFKFSTGVYENVPAFSNVLDQTTMAGALYTTYSDTLKWLNYKAGLRYEFAGLEMTSIALTEKLNRTYGTLFPTVHLSAKTKNNDNYTLSYSRRVRYPQWELDPFANRINEESVFYGNPMLDPAFTDAFEGGYAHFFKNGSSISTTLYHRRTNLDITTKSEGVYDTLLNRYTIYSTYINAGKNINTGGDFTVTWRPKPAYRIMFNANVYYQDFYADLGSYKVDKSNLTYDGKLIFMWNYKILRLNVMGIYRAASASLQGSSEDTYFVNANLNVDLFKKKLSIRLGMQDIFNWQESNTITNTPTYYSENYSKNRSQFLTFGITVRLGKIELEQSQMPPQGGGGAGL